MDFNEYSAYTLKDFLEDDDFINAVIKPTNENNFFWKQVSQNFPSKQEHITQASNIIRSYRNQDTFFNQTRQAEVWNRIEAEVGPSVKQTKIFRLSQFIRVAAAILLVGIAVSIFWYNREQTFQTAFGEIKTITMPDGSVVLLNGNSSLTYQRGWGKNSREVWLKGEGFFKVVHLNKDTSHIKQGERFIVHCNYLNVEVLGTTFNIKNRHNKIDVGLVTGKIKVTANAPKKSPIALILAPGDYVEYGTPNISSKSKLPHPEKLASWSKRQFIFNNKKLSDILKTLEDTYGYQIKYTNAAAMDMEIEGEINVTGVKELLETISTSLHVSIYQNNNQITIN